MSLPTDTDSPAVFKAAMQSLFGGLFGWVLICSFAGAIVTATTADSFSELEWIWAFAWIGHLAIAALGIWGLLVICVHALCVAALVHDTEHVLRVILGAFVLQLTTSTIVVLSIDSEFWLRSVAVWLILTALAVGSIVGNFLREQQKRMAWQQAHSEDLSHKVQRMYEPRPGRYGAVDSMSSMNKGGADAKLSRFRTRQG